MKYVLGSDRKMRERFQEHRTYVKQKKLKTPTRERFNLKGHTISNMTITILKEVKVSDTLYQKEREQYLIRKFNSYYNEMNNKEQ